MKEAIAMPMTASAEEHRLIAFNTSYASENKIHDDATAKRFGFAGGLVPGVDVFAYMTHPAALLWGPQWLGRGRLRGRFLKPVYDGREVVVRAAEGEPLRITVSSDGVLCAEGEASRAPGEYASAELDIPSAPLPAERPAASPDSLAAGTILGSLKKTFVAAEAEGYLGDIREDIPLYRESGIAHPGWLLRRANRILTNNVLLGPWIHVESDVSLLAPVTDGTEIETRARVRDCFERKGHKIVVLDVLIIGDGSKAVLRAEHTAIYAPRQVAGG